MKNDKYKKQQERIDFWFGVIAKSFIFWAVAVAVFYVVFG